jgi:hypothetical protein
MRAFPKIALVVAVGVALLAAAGCGGGDDDDDSGGFSPFGGGDTNANASNNNTKTNNNNPSGSGKSGTMTLDGKDYKLSVQECAQPQTTNKIFGAAAKTTDGKGELGISGAQDVGVITLSYDGTLYGTSGNQFKFEKGAMTFEGDVQSTTTGKPVRLKLKIDC